MRKVEFAELSAFVAIAERSSFAKAATHLGVSRSTLSETLRTLEEKLGVRLLNRTTRSVGLTEVGERLLGRLRPVLDNFEAVVESVNEFRDRPAGHLRISVPRPAAKIVIEPILAKFLVTYPAITLEVSVDNALTDIVRDRFDAGIRPGHRVEQDMVAVRVSEDVRQRVVASPEYLARHPRPKVPEDLQDHNCVRRRFASGVFERWIFEKRGKSVEVAIAGSLITIDGDLAIRAVLDGVAIMRGPASFLDPYIANKQLISLLEDWLPHSPGFFLYYPSRRQMPPTLQAFIDVLKAHTRDSGGT